jgi:hypothetical protein
LAQIQDNVSEWNDMFTGEFFSEIAL